MIKVFDPYIIEQVLFNNIIETDVIENKNNQIDLFMLAIDFAVYYLANFKQFEEVLLLL
jgi:hypothetical protein